MGKLSRLGIIVISLGLALWGLYPSIWWYFIADEEQKSLANMSRTTLAENLRLESENDLREFTKLVQEDQNSTELPSELSYIVTVAKNYQREAKLDKPDAWTRAAIPRIFTSGSNSYELMRSKMEDYLLEQVMVYRSRKQASLRLGLDLNGGQSVMIRPNPEELQQRLDEMQKDSPNASRADLEQSLQKRVLVALQNRVDQFGLTEPQLHSYQDGRIEILIPSQNKEDSGTDLNLVESFLKVKGSLSFHFVDETETQRLLSFIQSNPTLASELQEKGSIDGFNLPAGRYIAGVYSKDKYGMDRLRSFQVLETEERLNGEDITSAQLGKDQQGQWEINYNLSQEGATKQQQIFTSYGGRLMAIVLDGRVLSSPRISSSAGGASAFSGGRITGRFSDQEAKDLANVLNSGNLPVSLDIESQQVVGASLGEASVRSGLLGIAIGFIAVVIFMVIYYRGAGLIATLALILNLFFLIAILATLNSTLTLTGIAGIILTIGMSVDANVIIYERIKEELRNGKGRKNAIEIGFARAFWTIIDSNLTTGIAAVCLALFGNGAVQGFAVTLAWGIVCSLFTALFIARLVFDFNTDVLKMKKITIMWKKVEGVK